MSDALAIYAPRRTGSRVAALLWEEWRLTRASLGLVTAFGLLAAAALEASRRQATLDSATLWDAATLVTALLGLWTFGILLLSHFDRENIQLRFPPRLYTLPVRTSVLVATRMVYGGVATLAVFAITQGAFAWVLSHTEAVRGDLPHWTPADVVVAAVLVMAYLDAVCWTLGRFGFGVAAFGAVLLAPPAWLLYYGAAQSLQADVGVKGEAVLIALSLLACFGAAVVGVNAHRRGGFTALVTRPESLKATGTGIRGAILHAWRGGDPAAHSLYFLERRRRFKVFPWVFWGLLVLVAMLFVWFDFLPIARIGRGSGLERLWSFLVTTLVMVAHPLQGAFLAAAGALAWAVDRREWQSTYGRYLCTRPASTKALGLAQLRATAGVLRDVYLLPLCCVLVVATLVLAVQWLAFGRANSVSVGPLFWQLSFLVIAFYMSIVAWTFWTMGGRMVVITMALLAANILGGVSETLASWARLAVCLAVAGMVAFDFVRAFRLRLVSAPALLGFAVAWLVLWRLMLMAIRGQFWSMRLLLDINIEPLPLGATMTVAAATVALLALAPFAVVPLRVHRLRHG